MGWIIRIRILIFDFMVILSTISCFYRKSEEVDMDKVTAAMVLTSLSTSPLVRSPPVKVSGKSFSITTTSYFSPHEIMFTLSAFSCRNGLLFTQLFPVFTVTCA